MTLRELRERVEAATGADRDLDFEIDVALAPPSQAGHWQGQRVRIYEGIPHAEYDRDSPHHRPKGSKDEIPSPPYTSSVDAAIALVEAKGFGGHSHTVIDTTGAATAEVWPWSKERPSITRGNGATPALALLAALLRALEQKEQDNG
jgi:hypothetical protein